MVLGGVLLEVGSSRLPGWGFLCSSPALYLAAALTVGPAGAAWVALLGVTTRTLVRGRGRLERLMGEALSDLLPVLGWLLALDALSGQAGGELLATAAFLPLRISFPEMLADRPSELRQRARIRILPLEFLVLALGFLVAQEDKLISQVVLWLLVVGSSYALALAIQAVESRDRQLLQLQLLRQRRHHEQLETELREAERTSQARAEAVKILDQTIHALTPAADTSEAAERLLRLSTKVVDRPGSGAAVSPLVPRSRAPR